MSDLRPNRFVYLVNMWRWGDPDSHVYPLGLYSTFLLSLTDGLMNSHYRGGKYEPAIYMYEIDSIEAGNQICSSLAQANQLYTEITGHVWSPPEEKEGE